MSRTRPPMGFITRLEDIARCAVCVPCCWSCARISSATLHHRSDGRASSLRRCGPFRDGPILEGNIDCMPSMNTPADAARPQAIEIRFGQVGLVQLRLHTVDPGAILDELTGRTATAPHFFERTAVCLDLSALGPAPEAHQVRAVVDVIRRAGLLSVGLAQGPASAEALARELDVPVLTHIRIPNRPVPVVQAAPEVALQPAQMQHQPVRSGQRIYARNRDLIVTTTVAAGAEVMADGCVHIYGPLRGRVMAGVHGET